MSEATDTSLLLMRYGNRLQQASGIIVEYLVGSAIVSMGKAACEGSGLHPGQAGAGTIELAYVSVSVDSDRRMQITAVLSGRVSGWSKCAVEERV